MNMVDFRVKIQESFYVAKTEVRFCQLCSCHIYFFGETNQLHIWSLTLPKQYHYYYFNLWKNCGFWPKNGKKGHCHFLVVLLENIIEFKKNLYDSRKVGKNEPRFWPHRMILVFSSSPHPQASTAGHQFLPHLDPKASEELQEAEVQMDQTIFVN